MRKEAQNNTVHSDFREEGKGSGNNFKTKHRTDLRSVGWENWVVKGFADKLLQCLVNTSDRLMAWPFVLGCCFQFSRIPNSDGFSQLDTRNKEQQLARQVYLLLH